MSLRFIIGRAGSGKSTFCLDEIRSELRQNPFGCPLILLVPEQATYQMEVSLANTPDLGGILRAQVLSFRRLGWRIFSETGGGQKVLIGEVGKRMLIRRLLLKHRLNLKVFARSATRPGMADLLAQAIGEFKTYRVKPTDLRQVQDVDQLLLDKLEDLAYIYEEFDKSLGLNVRDPDDELSIVATKIPFSSTIRGAKVWVDGFKGFTPQELYVLKYILASAQEVIVALPLDPALVKVNEPDQLSQRDRVADTGVFRPGEEIFSEPWRTYQTLKMLALENGTEILPPTMLEGVRRFKNPRLQHLEKFFYSYPTQPYQETGEQLNCQLKPAHKSSGGIRIISAVNRRAEVEGVARELRRLAREEGLRWSEMSVMTRDLPGYQDLIAQVFEAYDIPHFLDSKRPVLHHPLVELILSAIELGQSDWAYEPLFRCLKTDFFPLSRDAVDRLENYCLAHGIHGDAWRTEKDWIYRRKWTLGDEGEHIESEFRIQSEINHTKQFIKEILGPFVEAVNPADCITAPTVRQLTEALYHLLIRLNVPEKLEKWAEESKHAGNLSDARLQEQIWELVLNVLDEMVASLGEETLELADYALILASGLENLKLGLIPPGLDQVLIGSLDRSRNPEVKVQFLLGANEGILPAKPVSDGVLDTWEREKLEEVGLKLAPKGKAQLFEEQFYIYTALTRATEMLYLTYPLTDEEGKGLSVSPIVTRLKHLFPDLAEGFWGNETDVSLVSHPGPLLTLFSSQLRLHKFGQPLAPLWQAVEKWYEQAQEDRMKLLKEGIRKQNQEERIPRPLARRLYGKRLLASVSRLEQFFRCPFAHYALYGLKLKERSVYELSSPDMGQFFHAVLYDFARTIREQGLDWGSLTKEQSWELVNELAERIVPQLQNEILLSNARYRYISHKLKRTVHHAVRVLGVHARSGIFVPIQLEVKFGPGETLPGIRIPLSEGNSLLLSGQIDRVDGALIDGQVYLRIFDYKSRQISLSLESIFYGLSLQLLAYLDVALHGAEILLADNGTLLLSHQGEQVVQEVAASNQSADTDIGADKAFNPVTSQEFKEIPKLPAGFLYFPVLEPQLEAKEPLAPEELDTRRIKAVKVKGFLLANRRVLEAMDKSLVTNQSDLLGLKINKSGEFKKGSNVLTEEEFNLLRQHLHELLKQAGEKILSGEISISPYRQGKSTGCQYCTYKPVCHFDPYLAENQYRNLPALKNEEVWQKIKNYVETDKGLTASGQGMSRNGKREIRTRKEKRELKWLGEEEGEGDE